jgi:stage V sporulation protein B
MKQMSLKKQAMITAGSSALMRALGFGIRLWISRMLGAEALGIMELASGAHMLALTPAAAGLPSAVSRLTAKAETAEQRQLTLYAGRQMAAWLGLCVAPLFLLLSPLLAKLLGDERTLPALVFFAPCVLTVGLSSVYDGYFFGQGKALPPALSEGAEQLVRLCVVGALAFLVPRVTVAYRAALPAVASTMGEAAGLIVILAIAGRIPADRRDTRLPGVRKQLLSLSLPLLLNRLCHTALRSLCGVVIPLRLMAGGLDKAEAMSRLGMFSGMAMPLMFLPCLISGALAAVGGPAMARCKTKQAENHLAFRLLFAAVGTGLLAAAGLYVLSPYLANLFYRLPELTPLLRAAAPLAVLLPVQQTANGLMTGLGLQKRSLFAGLLGAAATLLCTWQWTPARGVYGAAFASMAGHGLTLFCELAGLLLRTRTSD